MERDLKLTLEEVLLDEDDLYDYRLINAASIVDPPEYLRCCKICDVPDKEHAGWCLITELLDVIERYR